MLNHFFKHWSFRQPSPFCKETAFEFDWHAGLHLFPLSKMKLLNMSFSVLENGDCHTYQDVVSQLCNIIPSIHPHQNHQTMWFSRERGAHTESLRCRLPRQCLQRKSAKLCRHLAWKLLGTVSLGVWSVGGQNWTDMLSFSIFFSPCDRSPSWVVPRLSMGVSTSWSFKCPPWRPTKTIGHGEPRVATHAWKFEDLIPYICLNTSGPTRPWRLTSCGPLLKQEKSYVSKAHSHRFQAVPTIAICSLSITFWLFWVP